MNRTTLHKHLCRIFLMIICCVGVPCKASILCTHPNNPYAVTHIQDAYGAHYDFDWDANGNLTDSRAYATHTDRRLCWTEDCCGPRPCGANRLQAFMERGEEGGIAAYYNYSADGERNIKLTSPRLNIQQNATLFNNPPLVYPTLYASSLVTLTKQGYTKHYFEEGHRICSKIGGGMQGNVTAQEIDNRVGELASSYDEQYHNQYDGIRYTFSECIEADPQIIDGVNLHHMLVEREVQRDEDEPAFFYHGDHLGSAAYLTYHGGVIQTLNYLPYGEDWVEYNFFHPDDNKCFETAERIFNRIRSTISYSKKIYKRFCKRSHRQLPDEKTIWAFSKKMAKSGLSEKLFQQFVDELNAKGLIFNEGQIIDARFVRAKSNIFLKNLIYNFCRLEQITH